jgi:hypothetical protein
MLDHMTDRIAATERPVPGWAYVVAHAIPLLTLPSGLWRVGIAMGHSMGTLDDNGQPFHVGGWEAVYILGISVFAEAVALTAFGLVRAWGEVVPRWIPLLGGRRVPPLAAVIPAVLGSVALIFIWTYGFRDLFFSFDGLPIGFTNDGWAVLMIACYAPLNLWGPLLLVLAWAYYRRRVPRGCLTVASSVARGRQPHGNHDEDQTGDLLDARAYGRPSKPTAEPVDGRDVEAEPAEVEDREDRREQERIGLWGAGVRGQELR